MGSPRLVCASPPRSHRLSLRKATEAGRVDVGLVYEDVSVLAVNVDEPEALCRIEPFALSRFDRVLLRVGGAGAGGGEG